MPRAFFAHIFCCLVFLLCPHAFAQGTLSFVETVPASAYAEQVNINTATAREIAKKLKGVGVKKAQLIVDYRQVNGRFDRVEDIQNVKGIGPKTLNNNKRRIRL